MYVKVIRQYNARSKGVETSVCVVHCCTPSTWTTPGLQQVPEMYEEFTADAGDGNFNPVTQV